MRILEELLLIQKLYHNIERISEYTRCEPFLVDKKSIVAINKDINGSINDIDVIYCNHVLDTHFKYKGLIMNIHSKHFIITHRNKSTTSYNYPLSQDDKFQLETIIDNIDEVLETIDYLRIKGCCVFCYNSKEQIESCIDALLSICETRGIDIEPYE